MKPLFAGEKIFSLSRIGGILVALFFFNGCALFSGFFSSNEEEKPASQLMSEGMASFEKRNYEAAAEAFQKVKDRYPYSPHAITAELKMADALYLKKSYEEAYEAYSQFEKLHPRHSEVPYVIYQMGMCHFMQVSTIDRDQSHTHLAKEEFERLIKRFPGDPYADKSRLQVRKSYILLAEHELYVADFYFKKKNYRAAMDRYQYILKRYPDFGHYNVALERLGKCKEKLAEEQKGS
jgi:outer membrane protein assembly factor BamD